MKKILITGAAGYIGGRLSYLLAENGYYVTALCYPEKPDDKKWLSIIDKVIVEDLTNEHAIDQITDNYFDVVIHLVSLDIHDSNKKPNFVSSINVLPVWNLLEMFQRKNNLKRFIYFSTIHIYGQFESKVIYEQQIPNPKNAYGLTHLMAENICNYYNSSSNISCINIRLSNSYGSPFFKNSNCWWLVVNDLCRTAFYSKEIVLKSDGFAFRDFIHYSDIYKAVNILINADLNETNTFNLSSGKTYSIITLAEIVRKVYYHRYGEWIPIKRSQTEEKTIQKKQAFTISNEKLKALGFVPKISIEKGINGLFEYFESI